MWRFVTARFAEAKWLGRFGRGKGVKQALFLVGAAQLPKAQPDERGNADDQQRHRQQAWTTPVRVHGVAIIDSVRKALRERESILMLGKILIVGFLIAIIYNLGAGLYYMFTDKGGSDRMVKALTRRIGLSILLIVLLAIGIFTGIIQPHGVNLG